MMAPSQFEILRHARTAWNDEHRIQGQTDIPLSREGKIQAERWAEHLCRYPLGRVLASDLARASETATILGRRIGAPISFDTRLREQDWGQWSGLRVKELGVRFPEILEKQIARGWEFTPPGGESRQAVLQRALLALRDAAMLYPGERILVVTHGGVIKGLLYHAHGREFLPWEEEVIKAYHLHRFSHDGPVLSLVQANALDLEATS